MGPGQLCDGVADCGGGEDEAAAVCGQHECGHGVRCGEGDTCLYSTPPSPTPSSVQVGKWLYGTKLMGSFKDLC